MFSPIDQYCERLAPGLWAEPLNLLTNAGFLLAAFLLTRPANNFLSVPRFHILAFLLFSIGIGSALFHSFANSLTEICDVVPIALFLFLYLWFFAEQIVRLTLFGRTVTMIGFVLLCAICSTVSDGARVNGSQMYFGAWVTLFGMATYVAGTPYRRHAPYFFTAFIVFTISLFARSLDMAFCDRWSFGTHFVWHLLNSVTLYLVLLGYGRMGVECRRS